MKKAILAAVVGLAVVASGAVYAQHRHHRAQFSAQDKAAFIDARIAAVHAGLQLTPDQEKNWPAVESAVRDFAKQRLDRAQARMTEREARQEQRQDQRRDNRDHNAAEPRDFDPVARLHERADQMAATAASLKKIADAADPLYKSLDDAQKRRLAVLTRFGKHGGGWGRQIDRHMDREEGNFGDHDRGHDDRGGPERL